MRDAGDQRTRAETLAAPLPPLLASAQHLAASVIVGDHGRRRAGNGDTFWQYRPAQHHDSARQIDWRRSARSDSRFVQDKEWQIAQSIGFWVDQSARMTFASAGHPPKGDRARLIALALAIVLARGGERIGLTDARLPPRSDPRQIQLMAQILCQSDPAASLDDAPPDASGLLAQSRAVFISDFLGDLDAVTRSVTMAADRGVAGALVQVLDPAERDFPFDGRCVFQSMSGTIAHEAQKAGDLRARYLERLAARQDALAHLARTTGWQYYADDTGRPATPALLWLYAAMDRHA